MRVYKPVKFRPLQILALTLRSLGKLLNIWPLLLIMGFIISPVSPHVRTQYTEGPRGISDYRNMCNYFGFRGMTRVMHHGPCPLILMIDRRIGI